MSTVCRIGVGCGGCWGGDRCAKSPTAFVAVGKMLVTVSAEHSVLTPAPLCDCINKTTATDTGHTQIATQGSTHERNGLQVCQLHCGHRQKLSKSLFGYRRSRKVDVESGLGGRTGRCPRSLLLKETRSSAPEMPLLCLC